jgi:hypothetical protein
MNQEYCAKTASEFCEYVEALHQEKLEISLLKEILEIIKKLVLLQDKG